MCWRFADEMQGVQFCSVRRPDCTLAIVDRNVRFIDTSFDIALLKFDSRAVSSKSFTSVESFRCAALEDNVKEFGLAYFGMKR